MPISTNLAIFLTEHKKAPPIFLEALVICVTESKGSNFTEREVRVSDPHPRGARRHATSHIHRGRRGIDPDVV